MYFVLLFAAQIFCNTNQSIGISEYIFAPKDFLEMIPVYFHLQLKSLKMPVTMYFISSSVPYNHVNEISFIGLVSIYKCIKIFEVETVG